MNIKTLEPDLQALLKTKGWFKEGLAEDFGHEVSNKLRGQFGEVETRPNTLRLSQMGPKCPRALWNSIRHPELAEAMPAWVENKFAFGHIIEAWAITLTKAAGHLVEGEQDELVVDGIVGHRDCVIDGHIVDIKSTTSYGFNRFKEGTIAHDDSFGYLDQLDGYLVGSADDPLVLHKDVGYLLAIDKQLGHICLYEHQKRESSIRERIRAYKEIVNLPEAPRCTCKTEPHGKSGNIKLSTIASYNVFKHACFPNLRTFLYSDGPVFLTYVNRVPDVMEIDKYGQAVYH